MEEAYQTYHDVKITDKAAMFGNTDLIEALELETFLLQASNSISQPLLEKESRGAHARWL